jgi:hypothetical protein
VNCDEGLHFLARVGGEGCYFGSGGKHWGH